MDALKGQFALSSPAVQDTIKAVMLGVAMDLAGQHRSDMNTIIMSGGITGVTMVLFYGFVQPQLNKM